jgi:hypothetical protein
LSGLLEETVEAHGGAERFAAARAISARIESGGFAIATKGRSRSFAAYECRVATAEPHAVLSPYPGPGRRGVFTPERVHVETEDGRVVEERLDARSRFPGGRRLLWWDPLDALYFAGYALWNYLTTPWLLFRPGIEARQIESWRRDGLELRRLAVHFPPAVPTHSRDQVFHFDERGLLRQLDYTAEPFGSWAKAAHLCEGHREADGLVFPTSRVVYPRRRDGRPRRRPELIWIEIGELAVEPA